MIQSVHTRSPLSLPNDHTLPDSSPNTRMPDPLEAYLSLVTPPKVGNTPQSMASIGTVARTEGEKGEEEDAEQWPELESIVRKIGRLEGKLRQERRLRREAEEKAVAESKRAAGEQAERASLISELQVGKEQRRQLQTRLDQLQVLLSQKQATLAEKQQLLEELQFSQLKRKNEYDQKIRKAGVESKQLTDRLRKANLQLEQERVNCRVLKESMQKQISQMQSQREEYLVGEMERLKTLLALSEEERQTRLLQQVNTISRKVYQLEGQLKRKDIELSLLERKKQQAINEVVERKDGQIKVQKSLFKSLSDKFGKLQEELKTTRGQEARGRQPHRIDKEEEISFELSPDKV